MYLDYSQRLQRVDVSKEENMEELNLDIEDLEEEKYSRLELIPWWDQDKLKNAKIMVVGAGAIGNELIKNLTLLGIGNIYVFDIDKIENTNLTRSILFRAADIGKYKAEVAAQKAEEINPDIKAKAFTSNIITDVGLGVFRRMDIILGGLDNREARLAINKSAYKVNKPWIDGAIEALNGFARVFIPGRGPCYECTMSEMDWKLINKRKSCALLTHSQVAEGKIPTTPTSASVIAGIQVQEMLKLLHNDRNLPVLVGEGFVFNGLTHDSYVVQYQEKEDCLSHDIYEDIVNMPWSVDTTTIEEALGVVKEELGHNAVIDFDREIATYGSCLCGCKKDLFKQVAKLKAEDVTCEQCNKQMQFDTMHSVNGTEDFLGKTFKEIDIPRLHIIGGRVGVKMRYYEFSNDENSVFEAE